MHFGIDGGYFLMETDEILQTEQLSHKTTFYVQIRNKKKDDGWRYLKDGYGYKVSYVNRAIAITRAQEMVNNYSKYHVRIVAKDVIMSAFIVS